MQPRFSLTAVGDIYLADTLRDRQEAAFLRAADIFRSADVRFGNVEVLLHDYTDAPAAQVAGAWAAAPTELAGELAWLGVNLASVAHNHSGDYGAGGMATTRESLAQLGITHAGTGEDLEAARSPHYRDTLHGRVALIAASSTFMPPAGAGATRPDARGRPGINPLRFNTTYRVDDDAFDALSRILKEMPAQPFAGHREEPLRPKRARENSLEFASMLFERSSDFAILSEPNPQDLDALRDTIATARAKADWVVVSIHSHEYDRAPETPAGFLVKYCRAAADAGADIVVGHGPHVLRGIEIHAGCPIFYSLGAFIFQPYLFPQQPADFFEGLGMPPLASLEEAYSKRRRSGGFFDNRSFWEAVIARCDFDDEAGHVTLHPVDLWGGGALGLPKVVEGEAGLSILKRVDALSRSYGTEIEIDEASCTASLTFGRPGKISTKGEN